MALTCDLIVAARGAKFGIPEVKVGLFAAGGGLVRLPSRIGTSKAMEMAVPGGSILAEEAFQFGLIARLTAVGAAVEEALTLAERIALNAPLAVEASKALVKASAGLGEAAFWRIQVPFERRVFNSNDAKEGPLSFIEKRSANWSGT